MRPDHPTGVSVSVSPGPVHRLAKHNCWRILRLISFLHRLSLPLRLSFSVAWLHSLSPPSPFFLHFHLYLSTSLLYVATFFALIPSRACFHFALLASKLTTTGTAATSTSTARYISPPSLSPIVTGSTLSSSFLNSPTDVVSVAGLFHLPFTPSFSTTTLFDGPSFHTITI